MLPGEQHLAGLVLDPDGLNHGRVEEEGVMVPQLLEPVLEQGVNVGGIDACVDEVFSSLVAGLDEHGGDAFSGLGVGAHPRGASSKNELGHGLAVRVREPEADLAIVEPQTGALDLFAWNRSLDSRIQCELEDLLGGAWVHPVVPGFDHAPTGRAFAAVGRDAVSEKIDVPHLVGIELVEFLSDRSGRNAEDPGKASFAQTHHREAGGRQCDRGQKQGEDQGAHEAVRSGPSSSPGHQSDEKQGGRNDEQVYPVDEGDLRRKEGQAIEAQVSWSFTGE